MKYIIIFAIFCIFAFLLENKKSKTTKVNLEVQYYKKKYLTNAERKFFNILKSKINPGLQIIPQAVLSSFINTNYKNRTKIDKKTVDFLIIDTNFEIKCVIELDDKTHQKAKRIERDNFINELMQKIGIEIIHINSVDNFENQIEKYLPEYTKAKEEV